MVKQADRQADRQTDRHSNDRGSHMLVFTETGTTANRLARNRRMHRQSG